ncbi:hypothetical protein Btru_013084 [Bulinus truncatus]|nr:hypothetical protein Btru_013084 [Bulinus truncatus]
MSLFTVTVPSVFLTILQFTSLIYGTSFVETTTKYGPIRGVVIGEGADRIHRYAGIPFAKPPKDQLRFRPSVSPDSWTGVRDATTPQQDCMQTLKYGISRNVSEDCLYLNVFSPPARADSAHLPVMVWIFGGGFTMGSGWIYDGTKLARKGVVVVTFNYRLDAFGFMSTEDDILPGNLGLLDQIFALKWVKENIASFGGDPNRVTLFGESAGGCSVSLLSFSPLTKGLFKRVIIESGSALSPWCVTYPSSTLPPRKIADLIGSKVNCSLHDSQYVQCLQKVDAVELLAASYEVQLSSNIGMIFVPRVEQTFGVVPDFPRKLLAVGQFDHVDTMRGFNGDEAGAIKDNFTAGATIDEARSFLMDTLFGFFTWPEKSSTMAQLENLYLNNITDPNLILQRTSEAVTDISYVAPTLLELKAVSDVVPDGKHYVYEFSYRRTNSTSPSWVTAVHADELYFVFGQFNNSLWGPVPPSQDDLLVSEQMVTLWTNFAKSGDPTSSVSAGAVVWPAVTGGADSRLLRIDLTSTVTSTGRQEATEFYSHVLQDVEKRYDDVIVG